MTVHKHHLQSPATITITTLNIQENYKQQCINEIYRIGDKQNQQTNVKAIMSSYFIWEETEILNSLIENIVKTINQIDPTDDPRCTYILENCWGAIYKKDHYTVPHKHLPSHMSFTYYLQADDSSSPLVLDDCNFKVYPKSDTLVIFPSYIVHSVPKQTSEDDRICIAGNLKYTKVT